MDYFKQQRQSFIEIGKIYYFTEVRAPRTSTLSVSEGTNRGRTIIYFRPKT